MTMPRLPPQGTIDLITILKATYPVGAIYTAVVSTSPATLFGFGTWSAFGAGRMLVGIDTGDTDFDVVEETGGDKVITLTSAQIPTHTHAITSVAGSNHAQAGTDGPSSHWQFDGGQVVTSTGNNAGGGGSHKNVPPYIVVYRWKRTA